jgi:hypothetical protein
MKQRKRRTTVVDVQTPDGEVVKFELPARSVRAYNRLAARANPLLYKANSTTPDDPNPLTPREVKFVLSTLPEGSKYGLTEDGWRFE